MLVNVSVDQTSTEEELEAIGVLLIGIDAFVLVSFGFSIFAAFYALKKKLDRQDAIKAQLRKKLRAKFLSRMKKPIGGVQGVLGLFGRATDPTKVQPIQAHPPSKKEDKIYEL